MSAEILKRKLRNFPVASLNERITATNESSCVEARALLRLARASTIP